MGTIRRVIACTPQGAKRLLSEGPWRCLWKPFCLGRVKPDGQACAVFMLWSSRFLSGDSCPSAATTTAFHDRQVHAATCQNAPSCGPAWPACACGRTRSRRQRQLCMHGDVQKPSRQISYLARINQCAAEALWSLQLHRPVRADICEKWCHD